MDGWSDRQENDISRQTHNWKVVKMSGSSGIHITSQKGRGANKWRDRITRNG